MKRLFARMIVSAAIGALVASAILYVAVERALGGLEESVLALSSDMTDLGAATDALSRDLGARAERVEARLAALEARLDSSMMPDASVASRSSGAPAGPDVETRAETRAETVARIAAILAEADALAPERREEIRALLDTLVATDAAPPPEADDTRAAGPASANGAAPAAAASGGSGAGENAPSRPEQSPAE